MPNQSALGLAVESLDVMVVEDARSMQSLVRSMLAGLGIERVRMMDSAEQAIQAMLGAPPDVVIANWRMEPTSGYQLLQTLRRKAMEPLCFIPFIMLSAHSTRALVEMAFRAGAHDFLAKPLAPNVLQQSLRRLVTDKRAFRLDGDAYVIDGVSERLEHLRESERALEQARRYDYAEGTAPPSSGPQPLPDPDQPDGPRRTPRRSYGAVTGG